MKAIEGRKVSTHAAFARVESLIIVRASDVSTYVHYGAADLGITGKDVLNEHDGSGLVAVEHISDISSRLVVNQAALKLKRGLVQPVIDASAKAVGARDAA